MSPRTIADTGGDVGQAPARERSWSAGNARAAAPLPEFIARALPFERSCVAVGALRLHVRPGGGASFSLVLPLRAG